MCSGPSVFIVSLACFVSWFPLPVHIYLLQFSRFPCSGRIVYSQLCLLFCTLFVLFCTLPVLCKLLLHRRVYLLCLMHIFLSQVFVALRFVSEIQGFFSIFVCFVFACVNFPFSSSLEIPLYSEGYFLSLLLRFRFEGDEILLCSEGYFLCLL